MVKYLENENFENLIKNGKVLVDFYADWCGPCKMMGNVLENLTDITDIEIIKVNTDIYHELAIKYGIMSIPTLIFFKDGKEVKKEIGFRSEEEIRKIISEI